MLCSIFNQKECIEVKHKAMNQPILKAIMDNIETSKPSIRVSPWRKSKENLVPNPDQFQFLNSRPGKTVQHVVYRRFHRVDSTAPSSVAAGVR